MSYFRKIIVGISGGLLPVLLFIFGLAFSAYQVLDNPHNIKHALSESGIYAAAADNFIAKASEDASNSNVQSVGDIPLDQPKVREAVRTALPSESLQPQLEQATDAIYAWLHGETKELAIRVDLEANKAGLVHNLVVYAKQRAAELPACTPQTAVQPEDSIFTANCRPAMVSPEQAAAATEAKVTQSDLLREASFDTRTLTDAQGRTLSDRLSEVPAIYAKVIVAIFITGGLGLACLLCVIFISKPKRIGLKRVAKTVLGVGVTTIIMAALSVYVTGKVTAMLAESTGNTATFQASITDIIHTLASDIRGWWFTYGILLIAMAIGIFVGLKLLTEKELIEHTNATPPDERPQVVTN